jgi:two-component system response regulator AtoC
MSKRPCILVVDDDAAMREMVVCMLNCSGYDAHPAQDADDALFALRARPFAAVLCDVHMPRRDGFSLTRAVPWIRPGTPVVLMSAFGGSETPAEAERAGAGAFVAKPFSSMRLLEALAQARGKRAVEARI